MIIQKLLTFAMQMGVKITEMVYNLLAGIRRITNDPVHP